MKYFINLKKLINLRNGKNVNIIQIQEYGINTKEDSNINRLNDSVEAQKL